MCKMFYVEGGGGRPPFNTELKSFLLISLIFDKGNKIMKPRRRDILSPGEQRFKDTVWFIFWSKEVIGPS